MPAFEMSTEQLRSYQGCSPLPKDFAAYWQRGLHEGELQDLSYRLQAASFQAPGIVCEHLWFTGVDGAQIHCKLLRPASLQGTEKLPAVCVFHGYMHHAGDWCERLAHAYAGRVVLVMEARGQAGLSEDVYQGSAPTIFGHVVRGVQDDNPDKLYYRNVYLDCAKAVRIVMAMDFVDSARVATTGKSQGGALALAAAALVPTVKLCAPVYPFLSDFKRLLEMDLCKGAYEGIYYYFKKCDPAHLREAEFFERLGYIDIQNHAPQVTAQVLWQTGLMDTQCPPSTQFAAYNKLACEKSMRLYPEYCHEQLSCAEDEIFLFFAQL